MIISAQKGLGYILMFLLALLAFKESSSLWDVKEIGCKSVGLTHISLLFRPIE
jgi:hypothetical protein